MANQAIIQQYIPALYWQQFLLLPYNVCPADLFIRSPLLCSQSSCSAAKCSTTVWDTCFSLKLIHSFVSWLAIQIYISSGFLILVPFSEDSHTLVNFFKKQVFGKGTKTFVQVLNVQSIWKQNQIDHANCAKEHQQYIKLITFPPAEEFVFAY